jgi:preprotein translocase subunit SecB
MLAPQLQLERSFFTHVEVVADQRHQLGQREVEVTTSQTLGPASEDGARWIVELGISVAGKENSPAPPYRINLHSVGTFTFANAGMPDVEKACLLRVTGVSILYSQAREYLLMLTARGPWGPLQLPTVSFIDNVPSNEAQPPQQVREPATDYKMRKQLRTTAKPREASGKGRAKGRGR